MNTDFIKGVVVPILTIVDENEKIDEAKQRAQVDYVINGGVAGILAFGSNGEFYMVEEDEMERGLKIVIDQAAGPRAGLFWHRCHQHQKVLPSGANGREERCGCCQRASAHVPQADLCRVVRPFQDHCGKCSRNACSAV